MALDNLAKAVRTLHEAVMGNPITMGKTASSVEAVKKAVDPSHPTEPIENNGDAPAGSPDALPPFGSMVEAAKVALLDRKDPHEAVEALLGEGEPEDETLVVRAVEAALALLDIAVKEPEPAPPEGE